MLSLIYSFVNTLFTEAKEESLCLTNIFPPEIVIIIISHMSLKELFVLFESMYDFKMNRFKNNGYLGSSDDQLKDLFCDIGIRLIMYVETRSACISYIELTEKSQMWGFFFSGYKRHIATIRGHKSQCSDCFREVKDDKISMSNYSCVKCCTD